MAFPQNLLPTLPLKSARHIFPEFGCKEAKSGDTATGISQELSGDHNNIVTEEQAKMVEKRDTCLQEQQADQKFYEETKRDYDTWRYLAILGVAVLTLVLMMFITFDTPIKIGLFIGSAAAVFISTIQYFETKSIPAFIVLLTVFCIIVFVIQKREKFFK